MCGGPLRADVLVVFIVNHIVSHGKTQWLDGLILIGAPPLLSSPRAAHSFSEGLYMIFAVVFGFYPGSDLLAASSPGA